MANQPEAQQTYTPPVLTPEERERRYAEMRRKSSLSPIWAVHRDPDMHIRWVRDDKNDIAYHRHLGYEFAHDKKNTPESARSIETVVPISEDGFYRHSDVILMQIDRATHEYYQQRDVDYAKQMVGAGIENFKETARRFNCPTFQRDQSGKIIS